MILELLLMLFTTKNYSGILYACLIEISNLTTRIFIPALSLAANISNNIVSVLPRSISSAKKKHSKCYSPYIYSHYIQYLPKNFTTGHLYFPPQCPGKCLSPTSWLWSSITLQLIKENRAIKDSTQFYYKGDKESWSRCKPLN